MHTSFLHLLLRFLRRFLDVSVGPVGRRRRLKEVTLSGRVEVDADTARVVDAGRLTVAARRRRTDQDAAVDVTVRDSSPRVCTTADASKTCVLPSVGRRQIYDDAGGPNCRNRKLCDIVLPPRADDVIVTWLLLIMIMMMNFVVVRS
jgi:hypothetical protein